MCRRKVFGTSGFVRILFYFFTNFTFTQIFIFFKNSLFSLIVDGIRYLELKPSDSSNIKKYGLENSPKLRKQFITYLFHFLLLPYNQNPVVKPPVSNENAGTAGAAASPVNTNTSINMPDAPISETPACLSESVYKRFKNDINLDNGDETEQVFILLINLFC
jgi:hypothetical protein